jgi:hypothetical protein
MWRYRNQSLHSNGSNKMVAESTIDAQITHFYYIQEEFAARDRTLFDIPLAVRLTTSLRSRKHWLTIIRRYHETTAERRMGQQNLITKFFTRAHHTNSSEIT